jgi:hypothetical protein
MYEDLKQHFQGRADACWNTANRHPDKVVQVISMARAETYDLVVWAIGKFEEELAERVADAAPERTPRLDEVGLQRKVVAFGNVMLEKLIKNKHKGCWSDESTEFLMHRLQQVVRECADVANFAMMVADVVGGLEE